MRVCVMCHDPSRMRLSGHCPRSRAGLLRQKLVVKEAMLAGLTETAREVAPTAGQRREAYFCTDQGCWIAEQYFCDESGCYIIGDSPVADAPVTKVAFDRNRAPSNKVIVQQGIFAPAVKLVAEQMGRKELNAFRASVIAKHTKVISAFVDTSESKFGQIALKQLFEAACVNMRTIIRPGARPPASPIPYTRVVYPRGRHAEPTRSCPRGRYII